MTPETFEDTVNLLVPNSSAAASTPRATARHLARKAVRARPAPAETQPAHGYRDIEAVKAREANRLDGSGVRAMADPILELSDVSLSFKGLKAINALSFSVERGEICALIGPNGAGKSSALNILNGVYRADAGHVAFEGKRLRSIGRALRRGAASGAPSSTPPCSRASASSTTCWPGLPATAAPP